MTESRRIPWRRLYGLPGVWQLCEGRPLLGVLTFMVFAMCAAAVLLRPAAVLAVLGSWGGPSWTAFAAMVGLFVAGTRAGSGRILIALPAVAFLLAFFALGKEWIAVVTVVLGPAYAAWAGRKRPPVARWGKSRSALVRERFLRSPMAQIGWIGVTFMYLVAFLGPFLAPMDPLATPDPANLRYVAPLTTATEPIVHTYLLGSDQYSRDILSRIIHGAWVSMTIGLFAVSLSASLGMVAGLVAGFFGGWVDFLLMRFVDLMLSIPRLVLLLVVMALFKDVTLFKEYRMHVIICILALTGWMGTSRLVRGEVLSVKSRDFVQAGRALGLSNIALMVKHVAPNCMAPVIVSATLGIGGTILVESALSFLSLGVPPPEPTWGTMINDGRQFLTKAWWIATFPGLAIVLAVMAFNLLGDGLRDALDPHAALAGGGSASDPDAAEQSSEDAA